MKNLPQSIGWLVAGGGGIFLTVLIAHHANFAVLNPAGVVASNEKNLLIVALLLMALVVLPVFFLTFVIAWKYRAENKQATYTPNWDHNLVFETIWWGVPCLIILSLAILTWTSSHQLDPSKALVSPNKPITVQVIGLRWKWLFLYPEQGIASLNYLEFPENTPVHFEITSDGPMNAFWIPRLGSQIYAMAGMTTQLNLMANQTGLFTGSSTNISGEGFSGMTFAAHSVSKADFDQWAATSKQSAEVLSSESFEQLSQPSKNNPSATYALPSDTLYADEVAKYMQPSPGMSNMNMQ